MSSPDVDSPEVLEVIIASSTSEVPKKGSREWVFTINNPTIEDEEQVRALTCRYKCWAPETGKNGTPHIQGYAVFSDNKTRAAVSKLLKRAWLAPRAVHAKPDEARLYIKGPYNKNGKDKPINPEFHEVGELPSQGKRTDLVSFHRAIQEGKRGRDLSVDHLPLRAKYPKLEQTLIYEDDEERAKQQYRDGIFPEVHVRWGPPGTGKTRYVMETHNDVYEPIMRKCGTHWWTGYRGQDVILLDEFDGQIPIRDFLRLIDRYPFMMETKGGQTWRLATKIYICSNHNPDTWYPAEGHQYEKLERRFTSVSYIGEPNDVPLTAAR